MTLQRFDLQGQLQDDFVYQYQAESNRLASVSDAVPAQTITYDTKVYDQGPIQSDGKVYRQITVEGSAEVPSGQSALLQANELIHLKQDFHAKAGSGFHAKWTDEATAASETLDDNSTFTYDAIGNLIADSGEGTSITWTPYGKVRSVNHSDGTVVNYRYDATGNRVEKQVIGTDSTLVTRYIRDASGNVLAIYENDQLSEQPIYGSSRLGTYAGQTTPGEQQLGHRKYELSNHLGNVLSVITDNVNMNADSTWATLVSAQDVFPFGLEMNGRSWQSEIYRYGFQAQEEDKETKLVNYKYRMHDPKVGRFFSVDPLASEYPHNSPYAFSENRVIDGIELEGLEYAPPLKPGGNGEFVVDTEALIGMNRLDLEGEIKIGMGNTFGAELNVAGVKVGGFYDNGTYNVGYNSSGGIIKERTEGSGVNLFLYVNESQIVQTLPGDGRGQGVANGGNSLQVDKTSQGFGVKAILSVESQIETPTNFVESIDQSEGLPGGVGWQNVGRSYTNMERWYQNSTITKVGQPVIKKEANIGVGVDIRALIHFKVEIKSKSDY